MYQSTMDLNVDRELERRVVSFLHNRQHALRGVTASADAGTVTLRGTVRSFYERQLCIEYCRQVEGLVKLVDHVEVVDRNGRR